MDAFVIAIILESSISKMDIIDRITGDDIGPFDEMVALLDQSFPESIYEKTELYNEIVYRVRPSLLSPKSLRDLREDDKFDIAKTEKLFLEASDSQRLIKRIQHQVCRNLKWISDIPEVIHLGKYNDPVDVYHSGIQVQAFSHFVSEDCGEDCVFTNLIRSALTHPLRELVGAYIIEPD